MAQTQQLPGTGLQIAGQYIIGGNFTQAIINAQKGVLAEPIIFREDDDASEQFTLVPVYFTLEEDTDTEEVRIIITNQTRTHLLTAVLTAIAFVSPHDNPNAKSYLHIYIMEEDARTPEDKQIIKYFLAGLPREDADITITPTNMIPHKTGCQLTMVVKKK